MPTPYATEMMTIAPRALKSSDVCFVGIGMPSRLQSRPPDPCAGHHLIYESGTLAPSRRSCRCRSATANCATLRSPRLGAGDVPLLAARRTHTVGFLGGAQIDKFAN